jgi:very-short-patch-repair endonuclease
MSMERLQQIGGRQLGLVTSTDACAELSVARLRTALRRGWLVPVHRNVLAFAGAERSWRQSVLAAVMAAGDGAVASHVSAATLWGIPGFEAPAAAAVEILLPYRRAVRLHGVEVHRTRHLPPHHVRRQGPIAVTSLERTLCDLDAAVRSAWLGRIVDELIVQKRLSIARLRAVHAELRRGARPSRQLGRVLAERGPEWDRADSRPEARIAQWLLEAGLPAPVQQYEVGGYRVDLAYPEQGVLIEYDGYDVHSTRSRFEGDRRRANALALARGATILRYTRASTREEVVREVRAALRLAS